MPNLVQAEFFHVGGDGSSLDSVLDECESRLEEGLEMALRSLEPRNRIKTVVRFFDYAGDITAMAQQAQKLDEYREKNLDELLAGSGLRRWWLNTRSRRLAGASINLDKKAKLRAVVRLQEAIERSKEVAVEKIDHRFRLLHADEAHEVVEAAAASKRVWLFVFKPNHILADSTETVARLM